MKVYLTEKESVNVVDYYLDWRLENKNKKIPKKDLERGFRGDHAKDILESLGISVLDGETRTFYVTDNLKWKKAKKEHNF